MAATSHSLKSEVEELFLEQIHAFKQSAAMDDRDLLEYHLRHYQIMSLYAFKQAGIDPASVPIYEIQVNDDAEACCWTKQFLNRKSRRSTAIFSMSDRMAFGALRAATQLGLKVPRDLSIIGFDDIPQAAGSSPALTTIRQPSRAKGQMAAAIVIGDLPYSTEFHQLSTELIVRESVAAPRLGRRS